MENARESLETFGRQVIGNDPITVQVKGQFEAGFVVVAAGKTALVCGLIIEFVGVLHGLRPVYQPIWREPGRGPTLRGARAVARDGAFGAVRHARDRDPAGDADPAGRGGGTGPAGAGHERPDGPAV